LDKVDFKFLRAPCWFEYMVQFKNDAVKNKEMIGGELIVSPIKSSNK
jgi:hypothetical protein